MKIKISTITTSVLAAVLATSVTVMPAFAQASGANQQIFRDEEDVMQIQNQQINQLEQQEQRAENKAQADDQKDRTYRLYAEKRIQALEHLKNAGGSAVKSVAQDKELSNLKSWLRADQAMLDRDQASINQINRSIANLRQTQTETTSNLGSDITAMRQSVQDERDDVKFQQMMQINQFNELQSEMGAASWGTPPQDGTFNSVGGYGFGGGYGYSMGGGRRW